MAQEEKRLYVEGLVEHLLKTESFTRLFEVPRLSFEVEGYFFFFSAEGQLKLRRQPFALHIAYVSMMDFLDSIVSVYSILVEKVSLGEVTNRRGRNLCILAAHASILIHRILECTAQTLNRWPETSYRKEEFTARRD